jgi:hypothetical protein
MHDHDHGSDGEVMDLLRRGIPLTLLLDLIDPFGPQSDDLLVHEGVTGTAA